jgi:hypothetical protein
MTISLDADVRVCPSCGTPPGAGDVCRRCGLELLALPELPTWTAWHATKAASSRPAGATRKSASIAPLRHPSERSRMVLALVASLVVPLTGCAVIVAGAGLAGLLAIVLILTTFVGSIWVVLQLSRARLLGQAVRVNASSMPELQELLDEVRDTLQYYGRLDVYVINKGAAPVTTTSFLGVRTLVVEGSLIGELLAPEKRAQLTFIFGQALGALKAKHARLDLLVLLLDSVNALRFTAPFITPWYRATAYSGDQIGMMCCSDLESALHASRRLLVGGEVAATMGAGDVLPQARLVQQRWMPRLTQLFLAQPHLTNRYANLLCFARYHDPDAWTRVQTSLDPQGARDMDELWRRSPHRGRGG